MNVSRNIRSSSNTGFTLVEIMIVVALIGLLAGIAIPNFLQARGQSQRNVCINNLRKIEAAVQQYALEKAQAADDPPAPYSQLSAYLKSAVVCPGGGPNATFASTYSLPAAVSGRPTCRILGNAASYPHVLPPDTSD